MYPPFDQEISHSLRTCLLAMIQRIETVQYRNAVQTLLNIN